MQRKYYLANREKIIARTRLYYAGNREKILARLKVKRCSDLEGARAREKAWRAPHLARLNLKNSWFINRYRHLKYRAKRRGVSLSLSREQYLEKISGAFCHYCQGPLSKSGSGLDRKNSALGYSQENSVPCCKTCNLVKGDERISYRGMVEVVGPLIKKERKEKLL